MTKTRWRPWLLPAAIIILAGGLCACTLINVNLGPSRAPLVEHTITGSGQDKVLLIDVTGFMFVGRTQRLSAPWDPGRNMIERLGEELALARQDPAVKALLVRIDSPGGTVAAADIIYHEIMQFKKETKIKVVASMMGVAASGGYYAAMAADKITALPTTLTGSIGVISLKLNLAGIMGRYGVETETIKSAPLKDMWSPFRPATEEERRIMQGLIDDFFQSFKDVVKKGRPNMSPAQFDQAVTARIFTARQALELGLIDQIAYPEEAVKIAKQMAGLKQAKLVAYHRPGAYRPNIYSQGPELGLDPADWLSLAAAPHLMYLWLPGLR